MAVCEWALPYNKTYGPAALIIQYPLNFPPLPVFLSNTSTISTLCNALSHQAPSILLNYFRLIKCDFTSNVIATQIFSPLLATLSDLNIFYPLFFLHTPPSPHGSSLLHHHKLSPCDGVLFINLSLRLLAPGYEQLINQWIAYILLPIRMST